MAWSVSHVRFIVLLLLAGVTVDGIRRILRNYIKRKAYRLPPGPTPLPFFGSVLSMNTRQMWLTFTEWRAKYGDVMYIRLLNTDVLVLNSTSVAMELLDKRSEIYSDRPFITTVVAPFYDFNLAFARYGEQWRLCRRIFQQTFRSNAALRFRPMQLDRARRLISNIINNPEEYSSCFSTFSSSVGLSAAYNYETSPRDDPMVSIIENFFRVAAPGATSKKGVLVKAFPFLLRLPEWFPGSIKSQVKEAHAWRNKLVDTPYQHVFECTESNIDTDVSMVSDHIPRIEQSDGPYRLEYETALKYASATTLNGSTSTTSSTLMVFALAMVENPHVWKRAQADIDAVVGTDRLPDFEDRSSLPYVDAIIREVLRWKPVFPIGGPHATMRSDIYRGYYIPSGTTVLVNAWAISRDEVRYPNGDKFMPERFLNAEGMLIDDDPSEFVFGFGRRICPGRHVADASLWSAIATMLATLDFDLAKDASGNDITFTPTFTHLVFQYPNPFPCRITPRPHVREVLDRVLQE